VLKGYSKIFDFAKSTALKHKKPATNVAGSILVFKDLN